MVFQTLIALCCLAPGPTRPPVTYVLDYGDRHLGHPEYIQAVASAPPHLLHLGKDVPMTHNWGPIRALGGENQAFGRDEAITRLTPEEVQDRIDGLTAMVTALHEAGATLVMPYICLMTIGGHEQTRTGFWAFYDHWDEYARFGLGPRPAEDPFAWLQRTADGAPRRFYQYEGPFYPPYKPNHRYAVSVNHPAWRQWEEAVVRLIARCGYDGAFVDNAGSERSHDPRSQAKFREYLVARYGAAGLKEAFGAETVDQLALSEEAGTLLGYESQAFWAKSRREHLAALAAAGAEVLGRPFKLFPNGGRPVDILRSFPDCEWVMYEQSIGPYGTNSGRARQPLVEDVAIRHYNRHLFEFLYPQSVGGRVRGIVLTRSGWPRTRPEIDMNPTAAELGMAEAAAFSGGGGYLLRPDWNRYGAALARYRRFIDSHPNLFDGLWPWGAVGVLVFAEQTWYGAHGHLTAAEQAVEVLSARAVPFVMLTEEDCRTERTTELAALVVPSVGYLSAAQFEGLKAAAERGRPVVLTGAPPAFDDRCRPTDYAAEFNGIGARRVAAPVALGDVLPVDSLRLLHGPDDPDAPVRVMVYRSADSARWIVHLVNYAVDLGRDTERVDVATGLRLVPPAEWRIRTARAYRPEETDPTPLQLVDGALPLPPLRVYQVIELSR